MRSFSEQVRPALCTQGLGKGGPCSTFACAAPCSTPSLFGLQACAHGLRVSGGLCGGEGKGGGVPVCAEGGWEGGRGSLPNALLYSALGASRPSPVSLSPLRPTNVRAEGRLGTAADRHLGGGRTRVCHGAVRPPVHAASPCGGGDGRAEEAALRGGGGAARRRGGGDFLKRLHRDKVQGWQLGRGGLKWQKLSDVCATINHSRRCKVTSSGRVFAACITHASGARAAQRGQKSLSSLIVFAHLSLSCTAQTTTARADRQGATSAPLPAPAGGRRRWSKGSGRSRSSRRPAPPSSTRPEGGASHAGA